MVMNDRKGSYTTQDYRYGYNGKENDNEVKGESNQQDYGFRVYDPRVGRFLSVDPLTQDYPMLTPYQYASNRPIDGVDLDGKEWSKSTRYNHIIDEFEVTLKLKIQVIKASICDLNVDQIDKIFSLAQEQFYSTYTGQDENRRIRFEAILEYEINDNFKEVNKQGIVTVLLTETSTNKDGDYSAGRTPAPEKGSGRTQTNKININTHVDGTMRQIDDIVRTIVHEAGHSGGLNHPWEIKINSFESDAKQGIVDDNIVRYNIMNSGANPNAENRYFINSGIKATVATTG